MHVMLQTRGLWIAVTKGISSYTEDRMALEVISNAMSVGMVGSIASKVSTKVVWESMTLRNVCVNHVCKAKASSIIHEFDSLTFNDGESVDDFGTRIGRIMNQLAILEFEYNEEEIVQRFL
jgi:hypothetical protein